MSVGGHASKRSRPTSNRDLLADCFQRAAGAIRELCWPEDQPEPEPLQQRMDKALDSAFATLDSTCRTRLLAPVRRLLMLCMDGGGMSSSREAEKLCKDLLPGAMDRTAHVLQFDVSERVSDEELLSAATGALDAALEQLAEAASGSTFLRSALGGALLAFIVLKRRMEVCHEGAMLVESGPSSWPAVLRHDSLQRVVKRLVDNAALLPEAVLHVLSTATRALTMERVQPVVKTVLATNDGLRSSGRLPMAVSAVGARTRELLGVMAAGRIASLDLTEPVQQRLPSPRQEQRLPSPRQEQQQQQQQLPPLSSMYHNELFEGDGSTTASLGSPPGAATAAGAKQASPDAPAAAAGLPIVYGLLGLSVGGVLERQFRLDPGTAGQLCADMVDELDRADLLTSLRRIKGRWCRPELQGALEALSAYGMGGRAHRSAESDAAAVDGLLQALEGALKRPGEEAGPSSDACLPDDLLGPTCFWLGLGVTNTTSVLLGQVVTSLLPGGAWEGSAVSGLLDLTARGVADVAKIVVAETKDEPPELVGPVLGLLWAVGAGCKRMLPAGAAVCVELERLIAAVEDKHTLVLATAQHNEREGRQDVFEVKLDSHGAMLQRILQAIQGMSASAAAAAAHPTTAASGAPAGAAAYTATAPDVAAAAASEASGAVPWTVAAHTAALSHHQQLQRQRQQQQQQASSAAASSPRSSVAQSGVPEPLPPRSVPTTSADSDEEMEAAETEPLDVEPLEAEDDIAVVSFLEQLDPNLVKSFSMSFKITQRNEQVMAKQAQLKQDMLQAEQRSREEAAAQAGLLVKVRSDLLNAAATAASGASGPAAEPGPGTAATTAAASAPGPRQVVGKRALEDSAAPSCEPQEPPAREAAREGPRPSLMELTLSGASVNVRAGGGSGSSSMTCGPASVVSLPAAGAKAAKAGAGGVPSRTAAKPPTRAKATSQALAASPSPSAGGRRVPAVGAGGAGKGKWRAPGPAAVRASPPQAAPATTPPRAPHAAASPAAAPSASPLPSCAAAGRSAVTAEHFQTPEGLWGIRSRRAGPQGSPTGAQEQRGT